MSDEVRGLAGDRRRNPFPSLNDTEYALWLATMREEIRSAVDEGMEKYREDNCLKHQTDTAKLKRAVFGATEDGVTGMDDRVTTLERAMATLSRITWIAVSALIVGFIGLLIGLIQFSVIGR